MIRFLSSFLLDPFWSTRSKIAQLIFCLNFSLKSNISTFGSTPSFLFISFFPLHQLQYLSSSSILLQCQFHYHPSRTLPSHLSVHHTECDFSSNFTSAIPIFLLLTFQMRGTEQPLARLSSTSSHSLEIAQLGIAPSLCAALGTRVQHCCWASIHINSPHALKLPQANCQAS